MEKKNEFEFITSGKIDKYHCEGTCNERCCTERYSHYISIAIHGVKLVIPLCQKHLHEILDAEI